MGRKERHKILYIRFLLSASMETRKEREKRNGGKRVRNGRDEQVWFLCLMAYQHLLVI